MQTKFLSVFLPVLIVASFIVSGIALWPFANASTAASKAASSDTSSAAQAQRNQRLFNLNEAYYATELSPQKNVNRNARLAQLNNELFPAELPAVAHARSKAQALYDLNEQFYPSDSGDAVIRPGRPY
jgi:lipopolysaccharide export LptBFGC system permease protein LptF